MLLYSLSDDADTVVLDVLQVCGDEMGVVSAEVLEEDLNFQALVVAQVPG